LRAGGVAGGVAVGVVDAGGVEVGGVDAGVVADCVPVAGVVDVVEAAGPLPCV